MLIIKLWVLKLGYPNRDIKIADNRVIGREVGEVDRLCWWRVLVLRLAVLLKILRSCHTSARAMCKRTASVGFQKYLRAVVH